MKLVSMQSNEVSAIMELLTSQTFYEFLKSKGNDAYYENAYYVALETIFSECDIPDLKEQDHYIPASDPIYTAPLQF